MPTREEIRSRRNAVAAKMQQAHVDFNTAAVEVTKEMKAYQADCGHPEEAKEYCGSHFKRRCVDCGKLL
jgi:hypothetical protein